MASNSSNVLTDLIRRKIVRIPNLRPKTKLGQRTVGVNQDIVFEKLKGEYYEHPVKLQPLVDFLKGRILEDEALAAAPEGIYTWILKQGHLYAMGLMSNQEIGSLHVNMDVLTLHQENVGFIDRNTLKNRRGADAKPVVAGEVLVTRKDGETVLYFNLQSGTFSEPLLKCRAVSLGEQRGLNKKGLKGAMEGLKRECRDEMVEEVQEIISRSTGIPAERVRFLSCSEEIQRELEGIRFLESGYTHGTCRDDDYMESVAGRNLIRRFMATTSAENMGRFQTYFHSAPTPGSSASAPGSVPVNAPGSSAPGSSAPGSSAPGSANAPGSSAPGSSAPGSANAPGSVLGKRRANTRNKNGNKNKNQNQKNQERNKNQNQTRKRL